MLDRVTSLVPARTSGPLRNLLDSRPVMAIFEATLLCNSACGYCDLPLNEGRYELSRDEINCTFKDLYRSGIRYLFIQGGEPMVRRDILEVLEDLAEIGFMMTLVTNGTRFTAKNVTRLGKLPVSISVSLDTLDRETYAAIRGRDQLPQVLAGLDLLRDYPRPKHLTCIISEKNKDHALDIARFAKAHGFTPIFGAYHWEVGTYGRSVEGLRYSAPTAIKVFQDLLDSNLVPAGYYRDYLRANIIWLEGGSLSRCDAGRYSIAIDASGNVSPCLAHKPAGNLLADGLETLHDRFDRPAIDACAAAATCNILCSRVVGEMVRRPVMAATSLATRKVRAVFA